jgi:hypothetical protein
VIHTGDRSGGSAALRVQDSFAIPDLAFSWTRFRHILHLRSRVRAWFKGSSGDMQMHCLPELVVRQALGTTIIADIRYTNTAAKDFNGKLIYLQQPPRSGLRRSAILRHEAAPSPRPPRWRLSERSTSSWNDVRSLTLVDPVRGDADLSGRQANTLSFTCDIRDKALRPYLRWASAFVLALGCRGQRTSSLLRGME